MIRIILCVTLFKQSINIIKMKQKNNSNKTKASEAILDFISGKTNTITAKRLTKSICSIQSLWQLAKITKIIRESSKD